MSKIWVVTRYDQWDTFDEPTDKKLFYIRCEAEEYVSELAKKNSKVQTAYLDEVAREISNGNNAASFYDYIRQTIRDNSNTESFVVWDYEVQGIDISMSVQAALKDA